MNRLKSNDMAASLESPERYEANQVSHAGHYHRLVYLLAGHALTGLGFTGMLLPILPTTVFWIGAAICYAKSSPRLYKKLIRHKRFGKPIQLYIDHGVISRQGKSAALIGMSLSALLMWLAPINDYLTLAGLMALLLAAVYVVSRPSRVSVV